jgi:hypothetical protein
MISNRPGNRQKIYFGISFLCLAAILMLTEKDQAYPFLRGIWGLLAAVGVFFYLWGRFFSRPSS